MNSPLGEDTDEENFDDPIKLFDSDVNAVYFGSQTLGQSTKNVDYHWHLEKIGNDTFCQSREHSPHRRPSELTHLLHSRSTSDYDLSQLCVKLVDCGKYPWYFRKYTQQILDIKKSSHTDSDTDVDVVGLECELDDCFIVEDLQDVVDKVKTIESNKPTAKANQNKSPASVSELEIMRRRHKEDLELQKALSQKNVAKVDFKRNQGLIGLKITQKIVQSETLVVKTDKKNEIKKNKTKSKNVMLYEKYLKAADKLITYIKESDTQCSSKISKEIDVSIKKTVRADFTDIGKVPVKFDSRKKSEKLIDCIKTKISQDVLPEDILKNKASNETIFKEPEKDVNIDKQNICDESATLKYSITLNKCAPNVKDIKKTNKYKHDQLKSQNKVSHSSLIGITVSTKPFNLTDTVMEAHKNDIKLKKEIKPQGIKQSESSQLPKKMYRKAEKRKPKKREPNSPILPCSSAPKKLKTKHEVLLKCETDADKKIKETDNLYNVVRKFADSNVPETLKGNSLLKEVIPKSNLFKKPSVVSKKQILTPQVQGSRVTPDKVVSQVNDNYTESSQLPAGQQGQKNSNVNKANDKFNYKLSNGQLTNPCKNNKTMAEQKLPILTRQNNVNNYLAAVDSASVAKPIPNTFVKDTQPMLSYNNAPNTIVTTSTTDTNLNSKPYFNLPNSVRPQFLVQNTVPGRNNRGRVHENNINIPVQNRYASAIILKPNHQTNFPVGYNRSECLAQNRRLQRPNNVPSPTSTHQLFRDHRDLYPQYYQSALPGRGYRTDFSSSTHPNLFPTQSSPMPGPYNGWLPQNLAHPPPPPLVPPPPPPPNAPTSVPVMNHNMNSSYLKPLSNPSLPVSQLMQNNSNQNTTYTENSSIIGKNNTGFIKKINIVALPAAQFIDTKKVNPEDKTSQNDSPCEAPEVVATKTEMLEELDKLSFADDGIIESRMDNEAKIEEYKEISNLKVDLPPKKSERIEPEKIQCRTPTNQAYIRKPIEQAKGYSPPILPIPTYQKVLDRVISNSRTRNEMPKTAPGARNAINGPKTIIKIEAKPNRNKELGRGCKRRLNNAFHKPGDLARRDDAKKISLEEYKKRISIKLNNKKYNNCKKRPQIDNKYRNNVDYSTETDLGYDSDSTVVL